MSFFCTGISLNSMAMPGRDVPCSKGRRERESACLVGSGRFYFSSRFWDRRNRDPPRLPPLKMEKRVTDLDGLPKGDGTTALREWPVWKVMVRARGQRHCTCTYITRPLHAHRISQGARHGTDMAHTTRTVGRCRVLPTRPTLPLPPTNSYPPLRSHSTRA